LGEEILLQRLPGRDGKSIGELKETNVSAIDYLDWKGGETIFRNLPRPEDGWATLPEDNGLGLELRDEVL